MPPQSRRAERTAYINAVLNAATIKWTADLRMDPQGKMMFFRVHLR